MKKLESAGVLMGTKRKKERQLENQSFQPSIVAFVTADKSNCAG